MKNNQYNSICMATYNGELFIKSQLISILKQINESDEVIIIDDGSKDKTIDIIKQINDSRIKLIINKTNIGVNKSFEKAIMLATGNYIFMADQDDIWTNGRYRKMINAMKKKNVLCISGNSKTIDANNEEKYYDLGRLYEKDETSYIKNIIRIFMGRAYYYGCAMAFSNKLKNIILPFPQNLESHDLWIAMTANYLKSNAHMDEIVLLRRIHGNNASVIKRSIIPKIRSRIIFLSMLRDIIKRVGEGKI